MKIIVVGSLMTDIFSKGIDRFPLTGEYAHGDKVVIGAGGRPRNIAEMVARLTPKNTVSMISKTVRDIHGLWKVPVDALKQSGVGIKYINILDGRKRNLMPGISLIAVDHKGRSQMYTVFGDAPLTPDDIQSAGHLFERSGRKNGMLIISISIPLPALQAAVRMAHKNGLRVLFDPGGIPPDLPTGAFLDMPVYLIKPNEYEAKILTGIDVVNLQTAKQAAHILQSQGYENVFITVGADGAYLITKEGLSKHILIPVIDSEGEKNEIGCGDQAMAALAAFLYEGYSLEQAAVLAVKAGTLQFHKDGVSPLQREELAKYL